jgi:hypothetical protein
MLIPGEGVDILRPILHYIVPSKRVLPPDRSRYRSEAGARRRFSLNRRYLITEKKSNSTTERNR